MKYIQLLVLILFLNACNGSSSKDYQVPDYEKMADRITAATAQKIESETGLRLCGVGGGAIDHIRKLNMSFDCYNEITMDQGRELLIYCVTEYLSAINSNEEIRPYLIHYPFTPKDVEIVIFISKPDRRNVPIGVLSVISAVDRKLRFRVIESYPIVLKQIHEETYEEAVEILERSDPFEKIRKKAYSINPI